MAEEQRKSPRRPLRMRLDYKHESGANFLFEYTQNISRGGIFIETLQPLPVGTNVVMRFTPPGEEGEIYVEGRVAWVNAVRSGEENTNPGMGIQFKNLSDENKDLISRMVGTIAYL